MDFFFLVQNISFEVLVFLILFLVLISFGLYQSYLSVQRILLVWHPPVLHQVSPVIDAPLVSPMLEPMIEKDDDEEKSVPEEKEVPIVDSQEEQEEVILTKEPEKEEQKSSEIAPPSHHKKHSQNKISAEEQETLINLISSIRTLIARGMLMEARVMIVQGLAIDKNHRELNLFLGQIYEQEGQYEKAEYIYKDMAQRDPDDFEVLEKLANVLIVEKKYIIAHKIYKKIHLETGNTESTLYMLIHIANALDNAEDIIKYGKIYILQWPKNPEILQILANAYIATEQRRSAIDTYKLLKNITPYSTEINETLQKLLIEEELAGNFETKEA